VAAEMGLADFWTWDLYLICASLQIDKTSSLHIPRVSDIYMFLPRISSTKITMLLSTIETLKVVSGFC